jgi:hypothetical protein
MGPNTLTTLPIESLELNSTPHQTDTPCTTKMIAHRNRINSHYNSAGN